MAHRIPLAISLALLATIVATPAASVAAAGSCGDAVRIQLRDRRASSRAEKTIVTLPANRLTLGDAARSVVVRAGGRRVAAVAARARGWRRIELDLDPAAGRVTLRVNGRVARANRALVAEQSVKVAKRARVSGLRVLRSHPCGATATPHGGAAPGGCAGCVQDQPAGSTPSAVVRPFAADSIWNAALPNNAALDPRSGAYVAELRRELATTNPWINTTTYSTPVYTVGAAQPTVHVTLDTSAPDLQAALDKVPIPPGARPAAGSDAHLVVWQPSTDTMWELWHAALTNGVWHARWGGRMAGVSSNPGYFTAPHATWGATATSLPLLGGLIRVDELRQGHIDHALAFALPHARLYTSWSWPAQRSDGDLDDPDAIPEGTRFRLDPTLDIDALGLPPVTAMIAKAVQRYGMVLRDKAGSLSFYAEDPTQFGANPYPALFGTWPNVMLARFPWDRLQALRLDMQGPAANGG